MLNFGGIKFRLNHDILLSLQLIIFNMMRRINYIALMPFFIYILLAGCSEKEEKIIHTAIKGVGNYQKTFNDQNDEQLKAAKNIGIKPLNDRKAAEKIKGKLVEISSNEDYHLQNLTHSIPFLVPKADKLLHEIGKNFCDSLKRKGLGEYKIVVSSVLRTESDIKKLRTKNGNASRNSTHRYGTTFDIAYARYEKHGIEIKPDDATRDKLKMILAEVLRDLRNQHRCYVKYEVKQACFHITTRK